MKNKTTFMKKLFLLSFIISGMFFSSFAMPGDIRFTKINPETQEITIRNIGDATTDISDYRLCANASYGGGTLSSLADPAELMLSPGAAITVVWENSAFNVSGGDLGLYLGQGSFGGLGNDNIMVTYAAWTTANNPRQNVAIDKGIWFDGETIMGSAPYTFTGAPASDIGASAWTSNEAFQVKLFTIDPLTNLVVLQNSGTTTIDISNHLLCSNAMDYQSVASATVVDGSLMLAPSGKVTLNVEDILPNFSQESGSIALLVVPNPAVAYSYADYLQWGSAGNGRAMEAEQANLWTVGDFVTGDAPYQYVGGGFVPTTGVSAWIGAEKFEVKIFTVDPSTNVFTLVNNGENTIDISGYFACSKAAEYAPLSDGSVVEGSLSLESGARVTIDMSGTVIDFDEEVGDFGLYAVPNPASYTAITDFIQWGDVPAVSREDVAEQANLWTVGDFITGDAPYQYVGGGFVPTTGVSAWIGTDKFQVRIVQINPETNIFYLVNLSENTIDVSGYFACSKAAEYAPLSDGSVVLGSLNLTPNDTLGIDMSGTVIDFDEEVGDFGLYAVPNPASYTAIADFVQWGGVPDVSREDVADQAGLWTVGDFVSISETGVYSYIGTGEERGMNFWGTNVISGVSSISERGISVYPNPSSGDIQITSLIPFDNAKYQITTLTGLTVQEGNVESTLNVDVLANGIYQLVITENELNSYSTSLMIQH